MLIAETLENVEGMSVEALKSGLGEDWGFETFPEYLEAVEDRGSAINVAVLLGHTPLRLYVMGEDATEREATDEEVAEMRKLVREALDAGAIGFATSKARTHVGYQGKPVPSRLAGKGELMDLTGVLGEASRGMIQATIGKGLSFKEFAEINANTGRRISWTALLSGMQFGGGETYRDQLRKSEDLIAAGHDVVPQVTCRPLNFEFNFKAPFVFESSRVFQEVSAANFAGRKEIYANPEFREKFKQMLEKPDNALAGGFPNAIVSNCSSDPGVNERPLAEIAESLGKHIVDAALDLSLANELEVRFRMPIANNNEDEVQELLDHPETVLGLSDAGAHASQLCDACFSTHLLGHWVRDKGTIPLARAIRMLTSRPAEVFGLTDRGSLADGKPADVVVFDLETVGASDLERVYDLPAGQDRLISKASGIEAVIVNGVLLRERNVDVIEPGAKDLPGRLLRNGAAV